MNRKKFKNIVLFSLEFILLWICAIEVNAVFLFGQSPTIYSLQNPDVAVGSELYTLDGKLIAKYYKENRSPVELSEINPMVSKALLATEDIRFYEHWGIDPKSSLSILWYAAKGDNRGGSTITQQLVKNMFKTRKSGARGLLGYLPVVREIIYKSKEWITSLKVEFFYSKDEILNMYLNTVDFGNNSFGIKVAARNYFHRTPATLTTDQAALLIGMLKAPSNYNPYTKPEQAIERRNVVLGQLLKYNYITKSEFKKYSACDLGTLEHRESSGDDNGSYIRIAAANALEDWCRENGYNIYSDGLKIYTTIESDLQEKAQEAMEWQMKTVQRRFNTHWQGENPWRDENKKEIPNFIENITKRSDVYKNLKSRFKGNSDSVHAYLNKPKRMTVFTWKGDKDTTFSSIDSVDYYVRFINCGMMTMDPSNGHILTWVGGINYKYFKYDHVIQAKRQPGSTFKPYTYLTAILQGYSPCDKMIDKAVTIKYKENGEDKEWSPHNADWVFSGREMSLRWAMGKSCNSITAQLTEKVGWDNVVKTAQKMGIKSPLKSVPSVCLGSNDVSLYEMVGSYGTFVNDGKRCEPMLIAKITDLEGNIIKEFESKPEPILTEEEAFLMRWMFQGGIQEPEGTSQALWEYDIFRKNNEIGGKTGTSSNNSDGWYMGLTHNLVGGVWVGASERSIHFRSNLGEGSKTALPIFGKFLELCYKDKNCRIKEGKFNKPKEKIKREYKCPSPRIPKDSILTDSLAIQGVDSVAIVVPDVKEEE